MSKTIKHIVKSYYGAQSLVDTIGLSFNKCCIDCNHYEARPLLVYADSDFGNMHCQHPKNSSEHCCLGTCPFGA